MENEIDHTYTQEIVCPWCGYEFGDSWEISPDSGEEECPECGKEFTYCRDIEVTYSTERKKCEGEHKYVLDKIRHIENPYVYQGFNWTIYVCEICHDEKILKSKIAEDGKPYAEVLNEH